MRNFHYDHKVSLRKPNKIPEINIGFKGKYKLEVIKVDETKPRLELEFDNLILNNGLLELNSVGAITNFAYVGNSSVEPSVTDTALLGFLKVSGGGATSGTKTQTALTTAPYTVTLKTVYNFAAGDFNNSTITEVGVGYRSSNVNISSRALIKDTNGNPTSITIASDEQLVITYYLSFDPPSTDIPFSLIDSQGHSFTGFIRPIGAGATTNFWKLTTSSGMNGGLNSTPFLYSGLARNYAQADTSRAPNGTSQQSGTVSSTNLTVVGDGTYEVLTTYSLVPAASDLTFQTVYVASYFAVNIQFTSPITKLSTDSISFQLKTVYGRAP